MKRGLSVRKAVLLSYLVAAVFVSFALVIVIVQTRLAIGVYLVLFGYIIVTAFKMGMIFQNTPVASNSQLNISVLKPSTEGGGKQETSANPTPPPSTTVKPPAEGGGKQDAA